MNAEYSLKNSWQCFIELLDSITMTGSSPKEVLESHMRHARNSAKNVCCCRKCLDIVTRAKSYNAKAYDKHDHEYVHRWMTDNYNYDVELPLPPREVEMDGYAANYLEDLDGRWWDAERKMGKIA